MSDFDDLMNGLGVRPIKKKNKEEDKKENKNIMDSLIDSDGEMHVHASQPEEESSHVPLSKKKKPFEKEEKSFEEALKFYSSNDRVKDDEIISSSKADKAIFSDRFSEIEEDQIMHTIDLHNSTLEEAQNLVRARVVWCYREKLEYLLIITGKGLHSSNGPVLKVGIKNLLITMSEVVQKVEYASKALGGEGAYVVRIRL